MKKFGSLILVYLFLAISIFAQTSPTQILPLQPLKREIKSGESHFYQITLKAQEFLQIKLVPTNSDIVLKLYDSQKDLVAVADVYAEFPLLTNNGNLTFIADSAQTFQLEVKFNDAEIQAQSYVIQRLTPRVFNTQDLTRIKTEQLFGQLAYLDITKDFDFDSAIKIAEEAQKNWQFLKEDNLAKFALQMLNTLKKMKATQLFEQGQTLSEAENYAEAIEKIDVARQIFAELGLIHDEAFALNELGNIHFLFDKEKEALEFHQKALALFEQTDDKISQNSVKLEIGKIFVFFKEKDKALENLLPALQFFQAEKMPNNESVASFHLGLAYLLDEPIKSIEYSNKSLQLLPADETNLRPLAMRNIGLAYSILDEDKKSIPFYEKALEIYQTLKNEYETAVTLSYLATSFTKIQETEKGFEYASRALPVLEKANDKVNVTKSLISIGMARLADGKYAEALEGFNKSLTFVEENDTRNRPVILNNIGQTYADLGNFQKAEEYSQKALELAKDENATRANILNSLGFISNESGKSDSAIDYYTQSLRISQLVKNKRQTAATLNNLGQIYQENGDFAKALENFKSANQIFTEIEDKSGVMMTLNNISTNYFFLKDYKKALEYIKLTLSKSTDNPANEVIALSNAMAAYEELKNPNLAIFFGKKAINKAQEIRQNIVQIEKETQTGYAKKIAVFYRALADLLIEQGRLPEAEQVLAMLKEEEKAEYFKREAGENDKLKQRVDLTDEERKALETYQNYSDNLTKLGLEYRLLADKQANGEKLTTVENTRFNELEKLLDNAKSAFDVFLRNLAEEFSKRTDVVVKVNANIGLQSDLRSWGEGVVSLQTLVDENRYRVILTTPEVKIDGKTEIKASELRAKIAKFRQAVMNPNLDPRPLGKELYDILIKPIEKQLSDAKAKTLLWSLDDNLRYLPLAALWDGKEYFGQKYQNVVITLESLKNLSQSPNSDWKMLGLGVTKSAEVNQPNGGEKILFSELPSVADELKAIIREGNSPNEKGILSGQRLLDTAFSENSLKENLAKNFKVIHIASHFNLHPTDSAKSFLLLGDGNILPLNRIGSTRLKFTGVELLTLSACNTAVGQIKADGREFDSFADIAQRNGAKSVLASLWSVADESTRLLMTEFYRLKQQNPQMSKAEAMQLAQKKLLNGTAKSDGKIIKRSELAGKSDEKSNQPPFKTDPNKPFAHPYFWSPFVLIGNWK